MIVYNITSKVRWDILEGWLSWQLNERIPAVLSTGAFDSYQFYRLLEQEDEEGPTFVTQYFTTSLERCEQFMIGFAPRFQEEGRKKWGDGFIAFRSLMESVG
jgi:hypothetical protein